jgi:peptidoglycan/xylan/chitin deacetylase (PgdA/CDA1 family)
VTGALPLRRAPEDALRRRFRWSLTNRSSAALFLGYHSVNSTGPPFLTISPELFEWQLALLRRCGYRSGGLGELRLLAAGKRLPDPQVFLTFDDGFRDNAREAVPLLLEHGFKGWFFVIPPLLDDGGPLAWPEVEDDCREFPEVMRSLTWRMVEEMADAGMDFGSHTLTHPHLTQLTDEPLTQELLDSRQRIIDRLGSCDALAYPFGHWSRRVASSAAAAGYSFAFSLPFGAQWSASRMSIPRIIVDYRDTGRRFSLKLSTRGRSLLLSPARPALRAVRAKATATTSALPHRR